MPSYFDIPAPDFSTTRHWYICGPDRGLVSSAYREIVNSAGGAETVLLFGDECSSEDVVYELLQPIDSGCGKPRLIVIEHAHLLDLSVLAKYRSPQYHHFLLAIGGEDRPARADMSFSFFYNRQASCLVYCRPGNDEALCRVVQRRLSCGGEFAQSLVAASHRDTWWLASELNKLALLKLGPSLSAPHVPLITSGYETGNFVGALLSGSKGLACQALPTPRQSPQVFRTLERLIVKGCLLYEAQKNAGWSKRVLSERTGLSIAEIDMLRSHINTFGRIPTERRLNALLRVSDRALRGDRLAWDYIIAVW